MSHRIFTPCTVTVAALALLLAASCESGEGFVGIEDLPAFEDDLVPSTSGKEDTGYLSNLAAELEGFFDAEVDIDVSEWDDEKRAEYIEDLKDEESRTLRDLASLQFKYAKNQLNAQKLHINLTGGKPELRIAEGQDEAIVVSGDTLTINYRLVVETIVSFEELEEGGLDIQAIQDGNFPVRIPADPRNVMEAAGETCVTPDEGTHLTEWNYFYYFDPALETCQIPMVDGSFDIHTLLDEKTTYPEYDKLTADGTVTVVVFYGAAGHEETVPNSDVGVYEWKQFNRYLEGWGFEEADGFEAGQRWEGTRGEVRFEVDVVSPFDLNSLKEDSDGVFVEAFKTHEIVLYNGHSFYGSLNVLENPEAYPTDSYQILFMNSCWSYEYYTEQVFEHKKTEADPTGWDLADVVNDTESGWFHNMAEESRILLANLFAGAEHGGRDDNRFFTWANIIGQMNDYALQRWETWNSKSHEIYGVSGVRTNTFEPQASE